MLHKSKNALEWDRSDTKEKTIQTLGNDERFILF